MAAGWKDSLSEYIRVGEPDQAEKARAWKTAIGLQDVDGLHTSEYLLSVAQENIEGKITLDQAKHSVEGYYEAHTDRQAIEDGTAEADIVSAHITALLAEPSFHFSPASLAAIHAALFKSVYKHAGKFRDYDITKKEWVLDGDTVLYSSYSMIRETLDYDFTQEKAFSYEGLPMEQVIEHLAKFIAGVWQIHPFGEGNTRTTAVFLLKYLRSLGLIADNTLFEENSWYFRNALVRANYNNLQKGIHEQSTYLVRFLENLLMGTKYELKNRYLHVDWTEEIGEDKSAIQSATEVAAKCKSCTLDELFVLDEVQKNPHITQVELSGHLNKSLRTVKSITVRLQEKGLIERVNGKRNGYWKVL